MTHSFPTRRSSDLQHRAAGRVAAEQGALRSLEHLHVLEVEQRSGPGAVAGVLQALPTGRHDFGEVGRDRRRGAQIRSEEHTSELQSLMRISYAVFCLKKKKKKRIPL